MSQRLLKLTIACSGVLLLSHLGRCQSAALENTTTIRLVAHQPAALRIPKSAIYVNPYWCQPDGTIVTEFVGFPDGSTGTGNPGFVIAAIGANGKLKARISPTQQLPPGDVDTAYIGSVFVNSDDIFLLLRKAPPTSDKQKSSNMEKSLFEDRDQQFLIASFASDGEYKNSVQLDLPFSPLQAAAFDSGNFVIAGVDYGTRKPRVAIVQQDGQIDRLLDLPGDISPAKQGADKSREHGTLAEGVTESAMMSTLVPDGTSVLLLRRGVSGPMYLISDSGEVKKIRLPVLKGFQRETVQGTTNGLLVTFKKNVVENKKGSRPKVETRSILLDRESLKPALDYSFQTAPYSAICSQGTEFVVLQKSKDGFETSVLDKAP